MRLRGRQRVLGASPSRAPDFGTNSVRAARFGDTFKLIFRFGRQPLSVGIEGMKKKLPDEFGHVLESLIYY